MVEITAVSGGCRYVNISWSTTGNNDECSVFSYNVTLSYVTMDDHVTQSMITIMNSSTITGLPDDTQVNITVTGIGIRQNNLTLDSTLGRTVAFESMDIITHIQFYKLIIALYKVHAHKMYEYNDTVLHTCIVYTYKFVT